MSNVYLGALEYIGHLEDPKVLGILVLVCKSNYDLTLSLQTVLSSLFITKMGSLH